MQSEDRTVMLHLHIPKCGGTTLAAGPIYENYADRAVEPEEDGLFHGGLYYFPTSGFFKPEDLGFSADTLRAVQRPDLRAVTGHFWYGLHRVIARPCEYVTLLRDPAQRLWSLYDMLELTDVSFEEFLRIQRWREVDNDQTRRVAGIEPPTGRCDGQVFDLAVAHLRRFAVVGTIERFDESFALMARELAWQKPLVYYPANVSISERRIASLAPNIRRLVNETNRWDAMLYEIANELLEERLQQWDEDIELHLTSLRSFKEELRSSGHVMPG